MVTGAQSRVSLLDGQFVVDGMSALGRPCGADGGVDLRLASQHTREPNVTVGGDNCDVQPRQTSFVVQCRFDMGRDVGV